MPINKKFKVVEKVLNLAFDMMPVDIRKLTTDTKCGGTDQGFGLMEVGFKLIHCAVQSEKWLW
jgi:hypothetical protein